MTKLERAIRKFCDACAAQRRGDHAAYEELIKEAARLMDAHFLETGRYADH